MSSTTTATASPISRQSITTFSSRGSSSPEDPNSPFGCSKIPTLDEILSDSASEPYSLAEFSRYLARNHCQEVLEFALDCEKYRRSYYGWHNSQNNLQSAACSATSVLHRVWDGIIYQYIRPDSPKEINISCSARDALLMFDTKNSREPVHPCHLEVALQQAKDLMKENALLQFVRSAKFQPYGSYGRYNQSSTSLSCCQSRQHQQSQTQQYSRLHQTVDVMDSPSAYRLKSCIDVRVSDSIDAKRQESDEGTCATELASKQQPGHWRKVSQKLKWLNVSK